MDASNAGENKKLKEKYDQVQNENGHLRAQVAMFMSMNGTVKNIDKNTTPKELAAHVKERRYNVRKFKDYPHTSQATKTCSIPTKSPLTRTNVADQQFCRLRLQTL